MNKFDFLQLSSGDIYLDNAKVTLCPQNVVNPLMEVINSNMVYDTGVGRSSAFLEELFNESKELVSQFIHSTRNEVIFVNDISYATNLIAYSFLHSDRLQDGDEILVSEQEHDSNFIIWQQISKLKNITINFVKSKYSGEYDIDDLRYKLSSKTKIVALSASSGINGFKQNVREISKIIREKSPEAFIFFDLENYFPYEEVDVTYMDIDAAYFSFYNFLSPIKSGGLYLKSNYLTHMNPFVMSAESIQKVTKNSALFHKDFKRFEAGPLDVSLSSVVKEVFNYVNETGFSEIIAHLRTLTEYFISELSKRDYIEYFGSTDSKEKVPIFSFKIKGLSDKSVVNYLEENNIRIASGDFGYKYYLSKLNEETFLRASLFFYNEKSDIDVFFERLDELNK